MKFLFYSLIFLSLQGKSQIQTDTLNNAIIGYNQIVHIDSTSKTELYQRAKTWISKSFISSKAVIDLDDREAGVLITKGIIPMDNLSINFSLTITIKEGRYKCEIENISGLLYTFGMHSKDIFPATRPKKKSIGLNQPKDWDTLNEKFKSLFITLEHEMKKKPNDF